MDKLLPHPALQQIGNRTQFCRSGKRRKTAAVWKPCSWLSLSYFAVLECSTMPCWHSDLQQSARPHIRVSVRAVTSTDFRNRLTVPPNSNRIRLTERFASPYGALCFHVFTGSDSPSGPSRLSLQVVSLLVSNQTSFTQIKRQYKIITCGVFMHKNKSLTWCHSPTVSSRIKAR